MSYTPETLKKMRDMQFPKAKFRMKIAALEKIETEDGPTYKVVNSKWVKGNRKEFMDSIFEDLDNGIERTIEVVNEEPKKFKINQIYMLATRDVVWIYMEA